MIEEEQSFNKLSKKQGKKLMNLHNNEAGRLVSVDYLKWSFLIKSKLKNFLAFKIMCLPLQKDHTVKVLKIFELLLSNLLDYL